MFKAGDCVILINENDSIIYVIKEIFIKNEYEYANLAGRYHRIKRVEPLSNLQLAAKEDFKKEDDICKKYIMGVTAKKERYSKEKYVLGKILHIDSDQDYLDKSLALYEEIGVYAYGVISKEKDIKKIISPLLDEVNPDIVVITGHDLYNNEGLFEIENYTNTKYFVEAIKETRKKKNNIVVIAGACQSNYEALIASGADFASSPKRINVHTFDPAIIAIKVASTSFMQSVDLNEVIKFIENGKKAFSGLQTLGKMRLML